MMNRRIFATAAAMALPGLGRAQAFPQRPVTWLVPYPPGGPGDLMARLVGEVVSSRLGQPVLVDNRPGAGGQIAGAALMKAEADGHTIMLGDTSSLCVNKSVYRAFSWDPVKDARGISMMLVMPMLLLVPRNSPYNSVAELVAGARGGGINYASQGAGSTGHLLGELMRDAATGSFTHVPYKGSAPAMNDLLGGQVDMLFDGVPPALPHLRADKLKVLAVAGPQRLPQLPAIPTMAELGYGGVEMSIWFGAITRRGAPEVGIKRLHAEILHAMAQEKVARRFTDLGFQIPQMSQDQFNAYIVAEASRWERFVKSKSITAE